jgi:hypothetical protein
MAQRKSMRHFHKLWHLHELTFSSCLGLEMVVTRYYHVVPSKQQHLKVTVHVPPGTGSFFGTFRYGLPMHRKAEKSACPLAAEGDSPIFAAESGFF